MKLPRDLSCEDLVRSLGKHWNCRRVHQEGSHIILERNQPVRTTVQSVLWNDIKVESDCVARLQNENAQ